MSDYLTVTVKPGLGKQFALALSHQYLTLSSSAVSPAPPSYETRKKKTILKTLGAQITNKGEYLAAEKLSGSATPCCPSGGRQAVHYTLLGRPQPAHDLAPGGASSCKETEGR